MDKPDLKNNDPENGIICGRQVQTDPIGQGHAWRDCEEIPADIAEELAAEMIDGQDENRNGYTATSGVRYRW